MMNILCEANQRLAIFSHLHADLPWDLPSLFEMNHANDRSCFFHVSFIGYLYPLLLLRAIVMLNSYSKNPA